MIDKKPMSPSDLEGYFRSLTSQFSKRCISAQQALIDLEEIQTQIMDLQGSNSSDGLSTGLLEHIERIGELNLDNFVAELLKAEQEEAEFLEDGSAPTPPVGFVEPEDEK